MKISILIGGKAGQGPNFLTHVIGEILVKQSYYIFYSRDYGSFIRGEHNFNLLTFSEKPVYSNESKIDILVAFDEDTLKIHEKSLKKSGLVLSGNDNNIYYAGRLIKIFGFDLRILENELRGKDRFEENIKQARKGYNEENRKIKLEKAMKKENEFMNGSQGVAFGAINSGLDVYYAYPMTPATPLLFELAPKQIKKNFLVLELENEIACVNAAVGSAITGAKSMVGTSGGGFDLMTEALSMAGMAEVPLVMYLAQRPGPSTGVPTYTGQGDLQMTRHSGHGEFPRLVLAPGDPKEAVEKTSEAFYFSQKYKVPCIIISDKHLAESFYTLDEKAKLVKSIKSTFLKKYNSYEHTNEGIETDDADIVRKNAEARLKKAREIEKEARKFETYKIFGNKNSKNLIVSWGSTKGAILDAISGLNCKFLQVLYIEPFPKIENELEKARKILVVENNASSPLSDLIAEKCLIKIKNENKILKYDARPFLGDELAVEIKRRLK